MSTRREPSVTKYDDDHFVLRLNRDDAFRCLILLQNTAPGAGIFSTEYYNALRFVLGNPSTGDWEFIARGEVLADVLELACGGENMHKRSPLPIHPEDSP